MRTVFYPPMKKLAPGLYIDAKGQGHLMVPELLDHFGYADTPENRDVATKAAVTAFQELYPDIDVHEAD